MLTKVNKTLDGIYIFNFKNFLFFNIFSKKNFKKFELFYLFYLDNSKVKSYIIKSFISIEFCKTSVFYI